jgi:aryl carrier-like protein
VTDQISNSGLTVSDEEVVGYVVRYLEENGYPSDNVTPASRLADLGLDSISMVELLLAARTDLTNAGRLPKGVSLSNLPTIVTVSDLGDLFRSLADGPR